MLWTLFVAIGSLLGALGVGAGAFGAHALKGKLNADQEAWFETAVRYGMFHALALLALGVVAQRVENIWVMLGGVGFILGTLLFSGSLAALVFTGEKKWARFAPIGGSLLILGWIGMFLAVLVL